MTESHDIGDRRRFTASFKDVNNAPSDPTTVNVKIREPDGALVEPSPLTPDSVGEYHHDLSFTKPGRHVIRFIGTGAVVAVVEAEIYIKRKEAI